LICYKDGRVSIKINTENRERKIGVIQDEMLFVDRSIEKHLLRKTNSYGFNYNLLKKAKSFKWVSINEDDCTTYVVPVQTILDMGKVMFFKNSEDGNSFEVQIFLNRDIIKTFKK
jgi:hypothetical protein